MISSGFNKKAHYSHSLVIGKTDYRFISSLII